MVPLGRLETRLPPRRRVSVGGRPPDPARRHIRNGRDLGEWVHIDVLFQAYFTACLILGSPTNVFDAETDGGIGAPFNPGNPYFAVRNLESKAVSRALSKNGTGLLPIAFPEGSPTNLSYTAGHATVAGACVTILKWFYDERFIISQPVVPTPDGLALQPYQGPPLTVGGELNKLASNIATGRNIAGVHWRSDARESLRLGEELAISILQDQRALYPESYSGSTFTRFDGTRITV